MKWPIYRICGESMLFCAWLGYRTRCDSVMGAFLRAADKFFIPLYLAGKIKIEETK
jgi:hypothetical protein